jgi:hypothetical protein
LFVTAVAAGVAAGAEALFELAEVFKVALVVAFSALVSRVRIKEPADTLSPGLRWRAVTTPAAGEGISIVALSDSRVMSESSGRTVLPGATKISMTAIFWNSPILGT